MSSGSMAAGRITPVLRRLPAVKTQEIKLSSEDLGDSIFIFKVDAKFDGKEGKIVELDEDTIDVFEQQAAEMLERLNPKVVILSFENITSIDSSSFMPIFKLSRMLNKLGDLDIVKKENNRLILSSVHPDVNKVLKQTKLDGSFQIYDDGEEDKAIKAARELAKMPK